MTPAQIRTIRKALGISQARLGAIMGVRHQTISEWERGIRIASPVSVRLLQAYADGYRPEDWGNA
jgi:DNA-binding transcriptional regulator YiaG